MIFTLWYHSFVSRDDIPRLDHTWQVRIKAAIEQKLLTHPEIFGKPLRRSLKGYRKLRVQDYRVIFRIEGEQIKIFVIQHRSTAYKTANKRLS
jgi:mRNA interferase RelE/StbE